MYLGRLLTERTEHEARGADVNPDVQWRRFHPRQMAVDHRCAIGNLQMATDGRDTVRCEPAQANAVQRQAQTPDEWNRRDIRHRVGSRHTGHLDTPDFVTRGGLQRAEEPARYSTTVTARASI